MVTGVQPEQHGKVGGNALRASVSGANDGLVSNLSLVMGVAGAGPQEVGGSAWTAATSSFALFVVGAIVPVAPFTFLSSTAAVVTSLIASAVVLFAIGAGITRVTGRSP